MREKTSSLLKSKRQRLSSSSSSDCPKRSHESSDLENNPSRNDGEKIKRKFFPQETLSRSYDSSSELDMERKFEKKKKKHDHNKKKERNSDSENDHSKNKIHLERTGEKSRNEQEDRSRECERRDNKHGKHHQKDQECRLSSEDKTTDNRRRKERYRPDKEDVVYGGEACSSGYVDRKMDSSDGNRRMQHNERSHDRRENGNNRRRHIGENIQRGEKRGFQGRDSRRNRWSDGGEGSRGSGTRRRRHPYEEDQAVRFDRERPIKQEPGLNNDESENFEWGRQAGDGSNPMNSNKKEKDASKEKPNFALSGKLTEDTNTVNGVVIKYSEPPEARKPRRRWRLYVFKGEENLPTLYLHRQSCFLIGRDRKVVDVPVDHPSCSKQHAAFQFRLVPYQRPNGTMGKRVRPYIIDLESANGTFVNNNQIEAKKYVELLERDVLKFGFSSREYVLLHEQSKESDAEDDDVVGT